MIKAFQSAASRFLGRSAAASQAAPAASADFDAVMKSVHEDLLATSAAQSQQAQVKVNNNAEFDLGAVYKERSRQELRQLADAALNGKGGYCFPICCC